jgi:hypothetical protein
MLQDKKKEMLNLRDYQVLSSRIKKVNKMFKKKKLGLLKIDQVQLFMIIYLTLQNNFEKFTNPFEMFDG